MKKIIGIFLTLTLFVAGCANHNGSFNGIGAQLLGATGLVSSSQAEAFMDAGSKLSKAATPLTEEQEYYLGRGVSAAILQEYPPIRGIAAIRYANRIGVTLSRFSDRPETFTGYHFQILETDEVNAMAAPSGFVFITRGFLKLLQNEDQLAAVLAHEIGHVVKGHGVAAISNANLTEALAIVGKQAVVDNAGMLTSQLTAAFGDSIKDVMTTLTKDGYSRSQEYEADQYAVELLGRTGYDAREMNNVLAALESAKKSGASTGWFSTHPDPEKRESKIEDEIAEAPKVDPKYVQLRAARFRVALNRK